MRDEKSFIGYKMKRKRKVQIGIILGVCIVFLGIYFWGRNTMASKQTYLTEHETNVNLQEEVASKNLSEETEQEGGKAEYVYDKLNRLKKVLYADGSYILYSYDKNGNIKTSKVTAAQTPTPIPIITATPHKENTIEVYYQNTNWENAYIHYRIGDGEWTNVPGVKMSNSNEQSGYRWKYTIDLGTATEATVCFNNGSGLWDSKNQENYKVYAGSYGIKNQAVNKLQNVEETPLPSQNTAEVYYYNTNWTNAYIHYKVGNGEWTAVPGKRMSSTTEQSGYTWKYVIELGTKTELTVCFNNGENLWDSRNQQNYVLSGAKSYGVKNENIYTLK